MAPRFLSKTRYLNGLQCLKYLWLVFNDAQKVPQPDAATQYKFDQGHLIGELARKLFPGGIEVPFADFALNLHLTRQYLADRVPLFEPGFLVNTLFARLDVLKPAGRSAWDIIEVKSSTSVKEENLHDVSFQKLCAERQGLTINKCYLAFINNQYVKNGEIDPHQLFTVEDITEQVAAVGEGIAGRIAAMLEIISAKKCPDILVGSHCHAPYACPVAFCWEQMPENNIFCLYRGGKKCFDLYHSGVLFMKDIPSGTRLNRSQEIQRNCDISGTPHIECGLVREFLAGLQSPVHYLDFETINPALPLFDGVRPYQIVPFQFSLHVEDGRGGLRHCSFLAEGPYDPRPEFLRQLKKAMGPSGSIVTYNQSFEEGVLEELAEAFPEYKEWIEGVKRRLVDLLGPFRNFHYYHPQQNGSASIKSVLPVLTGKSYEGLEIADGEAASRAFLNVTYGGATDEDRQQVRAGLEKYCGLDTEGMVWIVEKLREIC